LRESGERDVK
jgi:hypothetical protein